MCAQIPRNRKQQRWQVNLEDNKKIQGNHILGWFMFGNRQNSLTLSVGGSRADGTYFATVLELEEGNTKQMWKHAFDRCTQQRRKAKREVLNEMSANKTCGYSITPKCT